MGLPPTFIHVPESEPCVSADLEYANKLNTAGVYTEFHVWGGALHGAFELAEHGPYWRRHQAVLTGDVQDLFTYDLRRPWLLED